MLAFAPAHWQPRRQCPRLEVGELHVWSVELDRSPEDTARYRQMLSRPECVRADRFRLEHCRQRYIVGRGLLRWLLQQYSGIEASAIRFSYGIQGKPALSKDSGSVSLKFNSADSADKALLVFSRDYEVGIDLEVLPRKLNHVGVAARYFSASEVHTLDAFDEKKRLQAFLACWTRKEAYGKAIGVGIRYPLDKVTLCQELANSSMTIEQGASSTSPRWKLLQFEPNFPGVAALVVEPADLRMRFLQLLAK